jgi:hypothetical protein
VFLEGEALKAGIFDLGPYLFEGFTQLAAFFCEVDPGNAFIYRVNRPSHEASLDHAINHACQCSGLNIQAICKLGLCLAIVVHELE